MDCEPITVTDDDLGDSFGVALAAEAGALGWDDVFAELIWWQELKSADLESINVNRNPDGQSRTPKHSISPVWRRA